MVTHSRTSSGATPRSIRQLRAAALLLAVTAPSSGCITTMVWKPPPDKVLGTWEQPELRVFAVENGALLLTIPDTLRSAWGIQATGQARWLHLEADERDSLRKILQRHPWGPIRISWQGEDAPSSMRVEIAFGMHGERYRGLPGVRSQLTLMGRIDTFETDCRVTLIDFGAKGERRELEGWIELCHVERQPGSVWANLAWTPLAVLGDVVLAPIELIMWL